jgi:16S rRNA G966 N2-methylase RsmD
MRRPASLCYALGKMDEKNKLYFGDNLKILRDYVADASVDLIYLDPPFNSQATYNVLFKEKSGEESAAQKRHGEVTLTRLGRTAYDFWGKGDLKAEIPVKASQGAIRTSLLSLGLA